MTAHPNIVGNILSSLYAKRNQPQELAALANGLITDSLPTLIQSDPASAKRVVHNMLGYAPIMNSAETLHRLTMATLPLLPAIKNNTSQVASLMLKKLITANQQSPEGLKIIRDGAPSVIEGLATEPMEAIGAIALCTDQSSFAEDDIEPSTTAALNILPTLTKANANATQHAIRYLAHANRNLPAEMTRIRTAAFSTLRDAAETNSRPAINMLLMLEPSLAEGSNNLLCPHFARATSPESGRTIWLVPTREGKVRMLEDFSQSVMVSKQVLYDENHLDYYDRIVIEGKLLAAMFAGKATPTQTAKKIMAKTGSEYMVLDL